MSQVEAELKNKTIPTYTIPLPNISTNDSGLVVAKSGNVTESVAPSAETPSDESGTPTAISGAPVVASPTTAPALVIPEVTHSDLSQS